MNVITLQSNVSLDVDEIKTQEEIFFKIILDVDFKHLLEMLSCILKNSSRETRNSVISYIVLH